MISLSRRALPDLPVRAARSSARGPASVRVLQIGDGNFLRGFADWMIDLANGAELLNAEVTVVSPRSEGVIAKLRSQGGLFTVVTRGVRDGAPVDERRLITCVTEALNSRTQWAEVLAVAADPRTRICISNTTEAGIADVEEPLSEQAPASFPAKLAALLWERYQKLGGSSETGQIILPCELIENNGGKLRELVLQHARRWSLPDAFSRWVSDDNYFLNTLVDRIVPGFPSADAATLFEEVGYQDDLMVAAEPFHLWAIEAPPELAARLSQEFPLHRLGLRVVWTSDLSPLRSSKVRVLNGAHTAGALTAFGAGLDTVLEMTKDAELARYLNRLMFEEIVPFVPLPEAERLRYAKEILERFENPHIRHELISISLNSVSKWQVRVLPSILDFVKARGSAPRLLSFSLAALLAFYRGAVNASGDTTGLRGGNPYPIRDTPEVLAALAQGWQGFVAGEDLRPRVERLLRDTRLWKRDLNEVSGLTAEVTAGLTAIQAHGVRAALQQLLR